MLFMKFYTAVFDHPKRLFVLVGKLVSNYMSIGINPFENVIIAPLFLSEPMRRIYAAWRCGEIDFRLPLRSVIMDSGGYQVQTGKVSFDALCVRLMHIWKSEQWADYYVLPDHVPKSSDTDFEVERKVGDTLRAGERFLKFLPKDKEAIGVVHGRNLLQVLRCVRQWQSLGVSYLAFGSFGTSGPYGSVNLISNRSLRLLRAVSDEVASHNLKLHVFGISYPSYVRLLVRNGIRVASVDSAGWWKAASYRQIFFDGAPQRFVPTARSARGTRKGVLSVEGIENEKQRTGHDCPFCRRPDLLDDRINLALHNLIVTVDSIRKVCYDNASE